MTVLMCPGQGAQRVGMGKDLAERFPAARDTFGAIDETWAEPTGEYVVHVITSPLFGMATAVLYYALLERERARVRARDEPAGAGPCR